MPAMKKIIGASKLEAMVAVLLVSILGGVLLDRLLLYQEMGEKTAMETTVINLRTGLRLSIAELMLNDRMQDIGVLAEMNPVKWLDKPPPNYIGEMDNPKADAIPPGNWYYDRGSRQLVYKPNHSRLLKIDADQEKLIRFQVVARMQSGNGHAPPAVQGVALSLLSPYDWSIE